MNLRISNKGNMAFKFNYCNGKDSKTDFGFKRLCSKEFIEYNITKRKADWCSNPECACRQYFDGFINYVELEKIWENDGICAESDLLTEWQGSAEYSHTEKNDWTARAIRNAEIGGVCVFTAVKPGMDEKSRKIFCVCIIQNIFEGDMEQCGYVEGHSEYRIELSITETNDFNFWDFYRNENTNACKWGQGVFRYLYDEQAAKILKRLCEIKSGSKDEGKATFMFQQFCKSRKISIT